MNRRVNLCLGCDFYNSISTEPFILSIVWSNQLLGVRHNLSKILQTTPILSWSTTSTCGGENPPSQLPGQLRSSETSSTKAAKREYLTQDMSTIARKVFGHIADYQPRCIHFTFPTNQVVNSHIWPANLSKKGNKAGLPTEPDDHRHKLTETIHIKLQFYPGWRDGWNIWNATGLKRNSLKIWIDLITNVKKLWTLTLFHSFCFFCQ